MNMNKLVNTGTIFVLISVFSMSANAEPTLKKTVEWIVDNSKSLCDVTWTWSGKHPGIVFIETNEDDYSKIKYEFLHVYAGDESEYQGELRLTEYDPGSFKTMLLPKNHKNKRYESMPSSKKIWELSVKSNVSGRYMPICITQYDKSLNRFEKAFKHAIELAKQQDIF